MQPIIRTFVLADLKCYLCGQGSGCKGCGSRVSPRRPRAAHAANPRAVTPCALSPNNRSSIETPPKTDEA